VKRARRSSVRSSPTAPDQVPGESARGSLGESSRERTAEPVRSRELIQDPALALLALLPLAILGLNSHWIFSPLFRDAWIYYGFFGDTAHYLDAYSREYFATRLSVIFPGHLAHRLLPPLAANLTLHLALYWLAVVSVYLTGRLTVGRRAALVAALAMGGYPYFLMAVGWNYVDGFGIAYLSAAILLVTLACRHRAWRTWLALAGAAVTAMASANVFYVIFVPSLAAHFLVLRRQGARLPVLASALWAGIGGLSAFVLLGGINKLAGGPFFYPWTNVHWVFHLTKGATPHRHAFGTWLHTANWLVLPAVILLSALALLERMRDLPPDSRRRLGLSWQLHLGALVALHVVLHLFADMPVLEQWYAVSLLLPFAFLALAGQLAWLLDGLSSRAYATVVVLACIAPLLPPAAASFERAPELMRFPVALPLAVGIAAAVVIWLGARGLRATVAFLLFFNLSQVLVSNVASIFRRFDGFDGKGAGLFLQLHGGIEAVRQGDPTRKSRLWYDLGGQHAGLYDSVASAFILCRRMINYRFPTIDEPKDCDGEALVPGQQIAVFSSRPDALALATAALSKVGLESRFVRRQVIPGPAEGFTITFVEIVRGAESALDDH
jgi:hypothetical protein